MTAPCILAVIPARGGSKGLPGKNTRQLGELPLIGHVAKAAIAVRNKLDVILSTDSEEIADVSRRLGIEVPFLRPAGLATDSATSASVVLHALEYMEVRRGQPYDVIALLQPTCPFTRSHTIDEAIEAIVNNDFDFAGTVVEVIDEHPAYMLMRAPTGAFIPAFRDVYGTKRRQDLPAMFFRAGNVYVTRRDALVATKQLIQPKATYVIIDRLEAININDPFDWWVAEAALRAAGDGT